MLFRSLCPSLKWGYPFWPSGLTVRRSRPPTASAELRALEGRYMPIKKHRTPMPKWLAEKDIKFEKSNRSATPKKSRKLKSQQKQAPKTSPRIKTISIEAKCSCDGENENCFRCNGTGFYKSRIVTNIEECRDRIQEKTKNNTNSTQESQFSNDQRGGIYGIREHGRYSSNPLYEEDI